MSPRLQLMHVRLMHLHSHSRPRLSDTPVSCCCSFPWVCVFFEPQLDMLMGLFNECTFPEHLLSARNTSGAREGSPREPCLPVLARLLQVTCGSSSFITSGRYSRDPFGTSSPRAQPASLGHVGTLLLLDFCSPLQLGLMLTFLTLHLSSWAPFNESVLSVRYHAES